MVRRKGASVHITVNDGGERAFLDNVCGSVADGVVRQSKWAAGGGQGAWWKMFFFEAEHTAELVQQNCGGSGMVIGGWWVNGDVLGFTTDVE